MPVAETLKLALSPGHWVKLTGAVLTSTFSFTVRVALFVTLGLEFPITSGSGLSIGADVDRWEALEGPFSSMFVGTLILRFYL